MENRYEAEENKHEHDEGIEAKFAFGNGFFAGLVAAGSTFLSALSKLMMVFTAFTKSLVIIRPYDKSQERLPTPTGTDEKVHVFRQGVFSIPFHWVSIESDPLDQFIRKPFKAVGNS